MRTHPPAKATSEFLKQLCWIAVAASLAGCSDHPEATIQSGGSPVELLAGPREGSDEPDSLDGYRQADGPRPFDFPADHGPHDDFQTEWWYLTGHLDTADGRGFGFQWTLFRRALAPEDPERDSEWSSRQLYMAHFAMSDLNAEKHYSFERHSRGAVGLAGARGEPFKAWLEDWKLETVPGSDGDDWFPLSLESYQDGVGLSLTLSSDKPMVLHGDRGYSRKSDQEFGASYYYSYTRLKASGTVTVGGRTDDVEGSSWLDREWSTSTLAADQTGWDWFSLQLDSGEELMLFELRTNDPNRRPYGSGTWVAPAGATETLSSGDFDIEVHERWQSAHSGAVYPSRWTLRVPSRDFEVEVTPYFNDQELKVSFSYWEGAVKVEGLQNGEPVAGRGFVEMVGYNAEDP